MHNHVMAIDASQDILDLCADLLAFQGLSTTSRLFSKCTLEEIQGVEPDLLIIDYPPGGEHVTYALLQQLRATPTTAAIPVIVWTTRTQILDHHQPWFAAQHIQMLPKPCHLEQFFSTIMHHLANEPQHVR